ncbi:MAG TPA: alpha/beta hydrolase, partial [Anaerolineales bacterium]
GQVYQQRHGEHVRTMTLEGTTLLDIPLLERLPRSSQEALDLLLARCQADTACQAAYPNLEAELAALFARIEKQPVTLPLTNPHTGLPVSFNHAMLVQGLHSMLYGTQNAVMLPYLVHRMYQGNFDEITQAVAPNFSDASLASAWQIMNLTILCYEDWAKMRPAETTQLSQGSYMGYEDVRRFAVPEQVCARMPQPQPEALYRPVTVSSVPVLIITNQADPGNPQENVAGAKDHYPNSLNVVAPGQGHGYTGIDCRDRFLSAFIESGSVEGLNTSCLKDVQLPAFVVR